LPFIWGIQILSILLFIIAAMLLLLLVVGVHEYGHYLAARLTGVGIKRLSVGMGPVLIKKKWRSGVEFAFSLLPIGGYVSLMDEREGKVSPKERPHAFNRKPAWIRVIILAAGPVFSILLPIIIYFVLYLIGAEVVKPVVGKIEPQSIAQRAGLKRHDEILSVGGFNTQDWTLALLAVVSHSGDKKRLRMLVKNTQGQIRPLSLDLSHWQLNGVFPKPLKSLGISRTKKSVKGIIKLPFGEAFVESVLQTGRYIALNALVLQKLVSGKLSFRALGGPIAMFGIANNLFRYNLQLFFQFVALLSIAVCIVNILPIPGLDGGQILYVLIEKIRGKPISIPMQILLYRFSMIVLFIFFMQLVANDLNRLALMK
jgi:regulator of sigma E protease